MHAIKHTLHPCTLKVNSTCCLKMVMLRMWGVLGKLIKIQDHSPSMTLFKVALQMILVPKGKC